MIKEFIDKTEYTKGTPLNRKTMLAAQGFADRVITFNEDGSITEMDELGTTIVTKFEENKIVQVLNGQKTITKTTIFNDDGSISEVLS